MEVMFGILMFLAVFVVMMVGAALFEERVQRRHDEVRARVDARLLAIGMRKVPRQGGSHAS
jgi:hypothetical protein